MTGQNAIHAARPQELDPSSLIAHIQNATEHQKAQLARELHDELGGLLVGAVMDLAWAEQHLAAPAAELKQKLLRARQTLSAAIDLKRKLIEDLRPTLLDNVGLFAALRWHVQSVCKRIALVCTIELPEDEPRFLPNIPIALFRIVQEAFGVLVTPPPSKAADFRVTADRQSLTIQISTDKVLTFLNVRTDASASEESHLLAAVQQRIAALGGEFDCSQAPEGGTRLIARFATDSMISLVTAEVQVR